MATDDWRSLALGARRIPDDPAEDPVAQFLGRAVGLDQPSLADRMQRLSQLQRSQFQGAGGPGRPGSEQADLGLDIAGNLTDLAGIIRAYHGSPHTFSQYTLDKMGTGEGAQVYGHGAYFAENPNVARDYERRLATGGTGTGVRSVSMDGKPLFSGDKGYVRDRRDMADDAASVIYMTGGVDEAIADRKSKASLPIDRFTTQDEVNRSLEIADFLEKNRDKFEVERSSNFYTADLDVNPEDLLDWDLPLSQQPEKVRKSLEGLGVKSPKLGEWESFDKFQGSHRILDDQGVIQGMVYPVDPTNHGAGWIATNNDGAMKGKVFRSIDDAKAAVNNDFNKTGKDIYKKLTSDEETTSKMLRDAGIPGIRYLDQGSRTGGEGSRNIVMFRDDLIKLLERNGMPIGPE